MNETSATSVNTDVLDSALSGINLDVTANAHIVRSTSSASLETIFQCGGAGFVGSFVNSAVSLASAGEVRLYDNAIADANLLAVSKAPSLDSRLITASPCFFNDGLIVQAKADGASAIDVYLWLIAGKPIANTTLVSSKMTYINANAATTNYGSGGNAECRYAVGQNKRILLEFDLTSLPIGFEASAATLTLFASNTATPANDIDIYKVLKSWTEAGATWNTRDGSTAWSTAGLGAGTDKSATPDLSVDLGTYGIETPIEIDLTDIVNEWLSGSVDNNGLIFEFATLNGANSFIPYSDDAAANLRPTLVIVP